MSFERIHNEISRQLLDPIIDLHLDLDVDAKTVAGSIIVAAQKTQRTVVKVIDRLHKKAEEDLGIDDR